VPLARDGAQGLWRMPAPAFGDIAGKHLAGR
jgi:hypothetical protein